DPAFSSWG
uniref:Leucokinin-7 n=1 Tax=Rhyparobia maderae TaxID=36963 RepID=LCK7_RHYMA|nr:RecName: Full=Leucokinin-7; AltName: Full=Leucokinin VII; Short=L-VII [Rhyparobia maderae]prf//1402210A leucokinin VII [Rhyparobia maderae]